MTKIRQPIARYQALTRVPGGFQAVAMWIGSDGSAWRAGSPVVWSASALPMLTPGEADTKRRILAMFAGA